MPKRTRPSSDWTCREVLDAKAIDPDEAFKCQFCGTRIRWLHVLIHDDFSLSQNAGCCCAVRLCFDYDAEGAERELKNRQQRLSRFVDLRRWTRSRNKPTNVWRWARVSGKQRVRVTVFLSYERYSVFIADRGDDTYCHAESFMTQAEALAVAFGLIERLKDD